MAITHHSVDPTSTVSVTYPTSERRFRAFVVDLTVGCGVFVAVVILADLTRGVPGSGRVWIAVLLADAILYEPVMVWRFGATVGHRVTNLRVVDDASGGHPGFLRALARFAIKAVLGGVSCVAIELTRRHQAIHDAWTHTTVQIRDAAMARPHDFQFERDVGDMPGMPSRLRRGLIVLLYIVASYVGIVTIVVLMSIACRHSRCAAFDQLMAQGLSLCWAGTIPLFIVAGWRGQLLGASCALPPE